MRYYLYRLYLFINDDWVKDIRFYRVLKDLNNDPDIKYIPGKRTVVTFLGSHIIKEFPVKAYLYEPENAGWNELPDFSAWPEKKAEKLFDWSQTMKDIEKRFKSKPVSKKEIDDSFIEKRIDILNKIKNEPDKNFHYDD